MRQGQQNCRGRGNNRNWKSHNPLSRSFESNGPDVKIRGTPAHIAEKYLTLARDAQSSGDPVLAENYLQHAEHYSRIIMAYREQLQQQGGDMVMAMVSASSGGARATTSATTTVADDMLDDGFSQPPMPQHHGQSHQRPAASAEPPFGLRRQSRSSVPARPEPDRFRDRDRPNDRG